MSTPAIEAFMTTPSTTPAKQTMTYTTGTFSIDEVGFIQIAASKVLAAVARGELDLNRLAREELAARGQDQNGVWVGFARAAEIHTSNKPATPRKVRKAG